MAATEKGARVILLEKQKSPGGNSIFAEGLFAAESPVQRRMGIATLKDDVFKIAMDYSHWKINARIFRAFVEKSGDTIQWLENKGLKFGSISSMYPGIDSLTFHSLGAGKKSGLTIVKTLRNYCEESNVRLLFNCAAKKILTGDNGEVTGVLVAMNGEEFAIKTKSIIVATGGYSGTSLLFTGAGPSSSTMPHRWLRLHRRLFAL